jgi:two-component system cell cycle response regulator CpdR
LPTWLGPASATTKFQKIHPLFTIPTAHLRAIGRRQVAQRRVTFALYELSQLSSDRIAREPAFATRPIPRKPVSAMTAKLSELPAKRILLAEDDDSMRGFLERALEKAGYQVVAFDNGRDALDMIEKEPFTLLLTDIVMPLMDGIELARRASEHDPRLKIMFITGFAAVTLNNGVETPKDSRVLSKPFHLKDLVREVDNLLATA